MRLLDRVLRALPLALVLILDACGTPATAPASSTPSSTVAGTAIAPPAASATVPTSAATAPTAAGGAIAVASATPVTAPLVSYRTDIQPLFSANCASCHGSLGGLSLASYADTIKGGQSGVVVKPGNADGSLLVQKVKGTQTTGVQMPMGKPPLSAADVQKVAEWVAQGAKDN